MGCLGLWVAYCSLLLSTVEGLNVRPGSLEAMRAGVKDEVLVARYMKGLGMCFISTARPLAEAASCIGMHGQYGPCCSEQAC